MTNNINSTQAKKSCPDHCCKAGNLNQYGGFGNDYKPSNLPNIFDKNPLAGIEARMDNMYSPYITNGGEPNPANWLPKVATPNIISVANKNKCYTS